MGMDLRLICIGILLPAHGIRQPIFWIWIVCGNEVFINAEQKTAEEVYGNNFSRLMTYWRIYVFTLDCMVCGIL